MSQFRVKGTGTLTAADQAVTIEVRNLNTAACAVQVTGTFSATLLIEASMDGGTTYHTYAFIECATGATGTSITSTGQYRTELVGVTNARVRCSAYTSGTPAIVLTAQGN